ncbi:MAG: peptidylprolyl isomerase [Candidatus Aenigmarchaeota archaeon]|nr:peptidylprolyl isomerase [Candidatus Aenigmarchaeota archaeon]MBU5688778.1 peptidylprolyl isomerase [Candidatus Aenigmarchaeota archaeon]
MKEGDFILVDFVGKIKETGEIFDLTLEDVAKQNGIYDPHFSYKPIPVIVGSHMIIKGVEDELMKMNVGEKKKIVVKPEDGFGNRSEKLIKLIPITEFRKQDIDPFPGMPITMNGLNGRILAISGGRVKVDFNHVLAGKELEYELEIKKLIEKTDEKVQAIFNIFVKTKEDVKVNINGDIAEIYINSEIPREIKKDIAETIKKWIKDIRKIRFVEEFE